MGWDALRGERHMAAIGDVCRAQITEQRIDGRKVRTVWDDLVKDLDKKYEIWEYLVVWSRR